jgi:hypothetical protein
VVRSSENHQEEEEDNSSNMDQAELAEYRRQRDALYRKALEAGSRRIGGAAAYYAAEARALNKEIRSRQQSMQMDLFIQANKVGAAAAAAAAATMVWCLLPEPLNQISQPVPPFVDGGGGGGIGMCICFIALSEI